jgi:hypothetical protein
MIVTFKTKNHPDITMFGDIALKLIKTMGHGGTIPGAIGADEIETAVQRLQAAIDADKAASAGVEEQEDKNGERRISLAQRAQPLLDLLRAAAQADAPVMWSN